MTDLDLAYIAGFVDGEGCITVVKAVSTRPSGTYYGYQLIMHIANTDKPLLEWIQSLVGGKIRPSGKSVDGWKPCYVLAFQNQSTVEMCKILKPFIRIKQRQIQMALLWESLQGVNDPETREVFYLAFAKLNKRGLKNTSNKTPSIV